MAVRKLDIEKCKNENFQVYDWSMYEPMTIGPELYESLKPENLSFAQEMCDRFAAGLREEDERERRKKSA